METPVVEIITNFLKTIGLEYTLRTIYEPTLLPGIALENGKLIIDTEKLTYPGDLLHEAGHLAVVSPEVRKTMSGELPAIDLHQGGEIMAFAWSYAACIHLGLDPGLVFHQGGYQGKSNGILDNFLNGHPIGVPGLQWLGMTFDQKNAEKLNTLAYPNMLFWVREQ